MPIGLSYGKEDRKGLDVDRQLLSASIDDLDVLDLWPGGAELYAGATIAEAGPGGGVNASALVFANAADHYARWSRRIRTAWTNHIADGTIVYTSAGGSTANFRLVVSAEVVKIGSNLSAGTVLDAVAVLAPGPAAADGVLSAKVTLDAIPVASHKDALISFRVLRTGSHVDDANANALEVLLVTVVMRPA